MGQKRRRLALSCVACRRRKVKCDRTFPTCVRCQKGGVSCDYVSYTKGDSTIPTPGSDDDSQGQREPSVSSWTEEANNWHARSKQHANTRPPPDAGAVPTPVPPSKPPTRTLLELQERVIELETYVKSAGARPISSEMYLGMGHPIGPGAIEDRGVALQDHERALLRGKGFKTRYFGPSHAASLLLQYEELSRFVVEILAHLPVLEKARVTFKQKRQELAHPFVLPHFETLAAMVPEQKRTDSLVQEYFATMETTYRVLHTPTFFQSYKEFWKSSSNVSAPFLAQLLLICASVNSQIEGGPSGFLGRSSVARDMSIKWIEVVEHWLELQSQKHMTLEIFQVQVMLVLAKRLNCVKIKREWANAGHLLRLAMSAGLHREPTFLSKNIRVFDQEMRRRIWFTILEIETQACLDRGMSAGVHPYDWDCLPPLNIHDEDFDQTMEKMPTTRPITEFTRISFLCTAQQHLPLRLEMLARINSIRVSLENETAMEYDQQIRKIMDDIPSWKDNSSATAARSLSRLLMYEFLVLIHQPFTIDIDLPGRYFFSRTARRNAALNTLRIFTEAGRSLSLTLTNLRDDVFRACLSLCHDIIVGGNTGEDFVQDNSLAVDLISKSVDLMEERIRTLGQGFHSFWLATSALGLLRAKMSPLLPTEEFTKQTADRVGRLHGHMIAEQLTQPTPGSGFEDPAMSGASTLVGMSGHPDSNQPLPEIDPFGNMGQFNAFSDTLFDFDIADMWNTGGYTQF